MLIPVTLATEYPELHHAESFAESQAAWRDKFSESAGEGFIFGYLICLTLKKNHPVSIGLVVWVVSNCEWVVKGPAARNRYSKREAIC